MTDNMRASGVVVVSDDIEGVHYPFAKVAFGRRNTAHEVDDADGERLPVKLGPGGASIANSTSTPLVAGASWTGGIEDVSLGIVSSSYICLADRDGLFQSQWSDDGINWGRWSGVPRPYIAFTPEIVISGSHRARFFRLTFENTSGLDQTVFVVQTIHHATAQVAPSLRLASTLGDNSLAMTVRAALAAKVRGSSPVEYRNVMMSPDGYLEFGLAGTTKHIQRYVSPSATGLVAGTYDIVAAVPGQRIKIFATSMQSRGINMGLQLADTAGIPLDILWNLDAKQMVPPVAVSLPSFLYGTPAGLGVRAIVTGATAIDLACSYWADDAT